MKPTDAVTVFTRHTEGTGVSRSSGEGQSDSDGDDGDGGQTTVGSSEVDPLPLDAVFEVLKNQRRRRTIRYLERTDQPVTLSDLAEHIGALENDTTPEALTSTQRKRAYVGLYQCHLPKMDEMSVVEFNRDRGLIELGPNAGQLDPYLDVQNSEHSGERSDWARYYLALAGCCFVLFAFASVAGGSVGFTPAAAGLVSVLSLVALSVVHVRSSDSSVVE